MYSKLHFIINPSAGREEPVLSFINDAFKNTDISWDVSVTKKEDDAANFAQALVHSDVDAVCVYGGDGTVCLAAQVLMQSEKPLIVLPGGTANIMAKELGMPIDTKQSLEIIKNKKLNLTSVDMGICDGIPFLLRINCGFTAGMVADVDPALKELFGQFAYGVTAVQQIIDSPVQKYVLFLDNERIEVDGVAVVVANVCNIGVAGVSFAQGSEITDGKLDVLVLHKNDLPSVVKAVGDVIRQQESSGVYSHWQARDIKIHIEKKQRVLRDDFPIDTTEIKAQIVPRSLQILSPSR